MAINRQTPIKLGEAQRKQLLLRDEGSGFLAIKTRTGEIQFVEFYISFDGEVLDFHGEFPVQLEFDEAVGLDDPDRTRKVWLKAVEV
jgi:hypothetical protein